MISVVFNVTKFLIKHLTLICSNPNCRNLVCGTNSQRSHCAYNVEVAAVLRPIYNVLDRKCDHYMHGATCSYRGHHLDIESHVHRRHTFSGMFDQNRDGGLEYQTPDDDRDFMDVSVVKWDMINESLLLSRCPSRDGGVTLIEMQSPEVTEYYNGKQRKCDWKGENGKQCDDRNFVEGNHYEIEEHIRSYHLHIEANEDDNVNDYGEGRGEGSGHEFDDDDPDNNEDAAMESDDQEQSTVSSVASCSRHKFQQKLAFLFGIADFSDLLAGINKLGVFDVSSPISLMSFGHQHMTVPKKLQVLITKIAGNGKGTAKNLKKALKPIDDSVRKDFEDLTVRRVLQSKAGEAGQGKWKSTSNAEEQQPEDND
nr:hypothetical protein CFP56_39047 [Quercus suber]